MVYLSHLQKCLLGIEEEEECVELNNMKQFVSLLKRKCILMSSDSLMMLWNIHLYGD